VSRVHGAAIAASTVRALARPRRAIPLGLVLVAMLSAEWLATHSPVSLLVDALVFTAFCAIAPASWRVLHGHRAGVVLYVAVGAAAVGVLGVALPAALGLPGTYVLDGSALGVVLALFLVGGWGLGRDVDLEEGFVAERDRAERLAVEAERAQIMALRAQLDPHFLFNTLNAIAEWCRDDPAVAEAATLKLAAMLRAVLEGIRAPTWPLAAELTLLRQLFELHEIRDRERYRLVADVAEPIPDAHVPPMLLLPLAENAITHGPAAGHTGPIVLAVRAGEGTVELALRNPGAFTGRREGGEGIAIVERRLALAYRGHARLSIRAAEDGTLTELSIPLRPLGPEAP